MRHHGAEIRDLGPSALDTDEVYLVRDWIPANTRSQLFEKLLATLPLEQAAVVVYGRQHPVSRRICWHAPAGCVYHYSGLAMEPSPMTAELEAQRQRLESEFGESFNCVLVNHYRDGGDGVGWHADDEPVFGDTPTIASVSLGASRRFLLKHKESADKHEVLLEAGSLLVMRGTTRANWLHSIPKTRQPVGGRLNLTWRLADC